MRRELPWLAAVMLGVVVVGRPWGSGALLNLDLAVVGNLDLPDSLWSESPDVPRRAPLVAALAVLSPPLSGVTAMKLWMVAVVAVAAVGMLRHLADLATPIRIGGAVAFALSPFLLTRLGVGHMGLATAVALLPWSVTTLLRPLDRWPTTVLWSMGYAMCGYFGMIVAAPVLAVGFVSARQSPSLGRVLTLVATQAPWLLPALLAVGSAGRAAGAAAFPSDVDSLGEAILVAGGYGFWQPSNQIGTRNLATVAITMVLIALAFVGVRYSTWTLRWPVATLGVLGWVVAVASAVPGLVDVVDAATDLAIGAPWRETQRLAGLAGFALVSLAARGVAATTMVGSVRSWLGGAAIAAAGVAFVAPSLWGLDGRVDPLATPPSWDRVAAIVGDRPGTVLALPWNQYFDVRIAEGRRSHHPIPLLLDGDVISNHELGLAGEGRVSRDDREEEVTSLLSALRLGEPIEERLADLRIRWIAVIPDLERPDLERLRESTAVTSVVDTDEIALFEVIAWPGPGSSDQIWDPASVAVVVVDGAWVLAAATLLWRRRPGRDRDTRPS